MPNGGQHFTTLAECSRCHSHRVHMRRGWHLFSRWRCRKCKVVFFAPKWCQWIYKAGAEPPSWAIEKEQFTDEKPYLDVLQKHGMVRKERRKG